VGVNPTGSQGLASAFITEVQPFIEDALAFQVFFTSVNVFGVYDPDDFVDFAYVGEGDRPGQPMPPFVAAAFRTNRATRAIRRGYKRFAGVSETDVFGSGWGPGGTIIPDLGDALIKVLDWFPAPLNYFTPIVVQRQKVVVPGSDPVTYAWKYFPTEAEQREHLFVPGSWDYQRLTTQRSRQLGHGL